MAGKLCPEVYNDGTPIHGGASARIKVHPDLAKAYCDGRKAFVAGDLKNTNPFEAAGVEPEKALAWASGWEDANPAGNNVPQSQTCCAE